MSNITKNLHSVQKRIAAAQKKFKRLAQPITLVAVSKKQSIEKIKMAVDAGLYAFGENYVQEGIAKIQALRNYAPLAIHNPSQVEKQVTLEWHFIGTIQSNKCVAIAEHFAWVHSLSSAAIAQCLNNARPADAAPLNVCIQVKLDQSATKAGVLPDKVLKLAGLIMTLPKLRLRGLMTLPEPNTDFEKQRLPFRQLAHLLLDLRHTGLLVDTLSMGMSQDLEAAIAEGATIVRVGTAIFGERI
ncbi:MAG: YggS family pyridoxal phosphate-dependent enzyme [Gammaproteobacteria bacterium]|jgi:pyridoxal phosphate enzyme (YggS family)|nr:YggS family pyridoxal phosphate-dependent enzyme [Gammaproteobacteria bacterium]